MKKLILILLISISALGQSPISVKTPSNVGEDFFDKVNTVWYKSTGLTSSDWIAINSAASKYKVYTALITQSGTGAPVATVLENTLGGTIVWTYGAVGIYVATLSGAFTTNKTTVLATLNTSSVSSTIAGIQSTGNTCQIATANSSGTAADGIMSTATIEIRV